VNSHHHQAVNKVGEGLRAVAWAKDGIIESIEDTRPDRFILGLQWHPELSWRTDELSKEIFAEFVGRTRRE
jgi:putative glutamine amidotransferase